ncbi:MAG: BatA and WFA domain-containing protein [Planctomycetaceae bacterium]|nr:BatA and WFA domain-containing protein [Planctomycetaceae bacterium]
MSFLNPTAFLWSALAVPIVIFFLLKMRTRRVTVGSVMFWQQVAEETPPRALWLRLRHVMSLLVQLLLLLLLVFSLAGPEFHDTAKRGRTLVVVLDTSASMQAQTAGTSGRRFNEALARVNRLIDGLNGQDEMAIVTGARPAEVLCGLTPHAGTLRETLEKISCSDAPNDLESAVTMASLLVRDQDADIHLITDGCGSQADWAEGVLVDLVGEPLDNAGITTLQVRRSFRDPLTWQVLVEIQSHSRVELSGQFEIQLDGEILDVLEVIVQPGSRWSDVLEFRSSKGGVVTASVDLADGLRADNFASAILPARPPVSVTLVTAGQWFLQQVLAANALVELTVTDLVPGQNESEILVLDGDVPQDLPTGPVIVVQPQGPTSLWNISGTEQTPLVGRQQEDELTRNVRLDNVLMPQAARLEPLAPADVLIESAGGTPLLLRFPRPEGPVVVLNIGLNDSDLPLRTAFPILLGNTIAAAADDASELWSSVPVGQAVQIRRRFSERLPEVLLLKNETDQAAPMVRAVWDDESLTLPPVSHSGVYVWDAPDSQSRTPIAAIQMASDSEGSLLPVTSAVDRQSTDAGPGGRPVWWYLVLTVLILFGLEWCGFHRRWLA